MLGDNIRKIRKEKKVSINELHRLTGISLGYLSDLENNKAKNPALEKLDTIAKALDVPTKELLTAEEQLDMALSSLDKINKLAEEGLRDINFDVKNSIYTITTHFDSEKFTGDEQKEIIKFIEYIISKRDK